MSLRLKEADLKGRWKLSSEQEQVIIQLIVKLSRRQRSVVTHEVVEQIRSVVQARATDYQEQLSAHQATTLESSNTSELSKIKRSLGPRLEAVMDLFPSGWAHVDLGTDHAHLPIAMLQSSLTPVAVGIDIAPKPLERALFNIKASKVQGKLALALGDGILPLIPQEKVSETPSQSILPLSNEWISDWDEEHKSKWLQLSNVGEVAVTICGVGGWLAAQKILELPHWVKVVIIQANNGHSEVDQALKQFIHQGSQFDHSIDQALVSQVSQSVSLITQPTIVRDRLFITKYAYRIIDEHQSSHQIANLARPKVDHQQLLWWWVALSRSAHTLSKTPPSDSSYSQKRSILSEALSMWSFI